MKYWSFLLMITAAACAEDTGFVSASVTQFEEFAGKPMYSRFQSEDSDEYFTDTISASGSATRDIEVPLNKTYTVHAWVDADGDDVCSWLHDHANRESHTVTEAGAYNILLFGSVHFEYVNGCSAAPTEKRGGARTITGSGFAANVTVEVALEADAASNPLGWVYESATTDANGSFTIEIPYGMPSDVALTARTWVDSNGDGDCNSNDDFQGRIEFGTDASVAFDPNSPGPLTSIFCSYF